MLPRSLEQATCCQRVSTLRALKGPRLSADQLLLLRLSPAAHDEALPREVGLDARGEAKGRLAEVLRSRLQGSVLPSLVPRLLRVALPSRRISYPERFSAGGVR